MRHVFQLRWFHPGAWRDGHTPRANIAAHIIVLFEQTPALLLP
jgi:hypothetical protein